MLIFVPPLKWDFCGDGDCQFDSDSIGLGVRSSGAYLQFIFLEIGL